MDGPTRIDYTHLSPAGRIRLACELLASAIADSETGLTPSELATVKRRAAAIDAGGASCIPWKDVRESHSLPAGNLLKLPLAIDSETLEDAQALAAGYESARPGNGAELRRYFDATLRAIVRRPDSNQVIEAEFRRAIDSWLQFKVVYRITASMIQVVGVFSTRIDP